MSGIAEYFTAGTPTADQEHFFRAFQGFIARTDGPSVFILRGYAGTGKTTLMSAVLPWLHNLGFSSELLAPTGRAAKVLQQYAGRRASTIHRRIYSPVPMTGGGIVFRRIPNRSFRTVFVVDEASMISGTERPEDAAFGGTHLLRDLLDFALEGKGCLLLIVGDVAQLPPVGERVSPALSARRLKDFYNTAAIMVELTTVTRQALDSGILINATRLRNLLLNGHFQPVLSLHMDVKCLQGSDLEEALFDAFREGREQAVVISPTNRRANDFNRQIRFSVYGREGELDAGDRLMVVRNNYHWLPTDHPAGFIANGDIAEVLRVIDHEDSCGFRFARAEIQLVDYPEVPSFEALVLLDVLHSYGPSLSAEEARKLRSELLVQSGIKASARQAAEMLRDNPYINALQVKYAYAVTGHKAQGGQWPEVFVDAGYLTDERMDLQYMRWLYTAVTRAKERLYLVGFPDKFFEDNADAP